MKRESCLTTLALRLLAGFLLPEVITDPVGAAPNVQQWQWRNPLPQGNDLHALAYGAGRLNRAASKANSYQFEPRSVKSKFLSV